MSASKKSPTGRAPAARPNFQSIHPRTIEARRILDALLAASRAPKYEPQFAGAIEGWVVNFLSQNRWRVARTMEMADCLQEAYVVFLRVKERYPDVEDPAHFMALFKTSWVRYFDDLSNTDSKVREHEVQAYAERPGDDEERAPYAELVGEVQNDGELQVMLRQAPNEVTQVLNLLLRAPQEALDVLLAGFKGRDLRKQSGGSEHINRLLGLPPHLNVLQRVEDYFRR